MPSEPFLAASASLGIVIKPLENKYLDRIFSPRLTHALLDDLTARKGGNVRFVQVGGNDGILADPISPYALSYGWAGTIMEPVPIYFSQLKKTYAHNPNMILLNIAIGPESGSQNIYFVRDEVIQKRKSGGVDEMGQGVASFDKSHVLRCGFTKAEIDCVNVPVEPLSRILGDVKNPVDFMIIDVEGAEPGVMRSMDWTHPVDLVIFESDHMKQSQRREIEALLGKHNYKLFWRWPDSFAVRPDAVNLFDILEKDQVRFIASYQDHLAGVAGLTKILFRHHAPGGALLHAGWSEPEENFTWSNASLTSLLLPTDVENAPVIAYEFNYVAYMPRESQTVRFSINGRILSSVKIPPAAGGISPAQRTLILLTEHDRFAMIEIEISNPVCPKFAGLGEERRHLGIALSSVRLITSLSKARRVFIRLRRICARLKKYLSISNS